LQPFKDALVSRWSAILTGLLVLALQISIVRLERFPDWDEAVFLSQSGGFNGIQAPPSGLVESRELGTPTLIGITRIVTETMANTRLVWILVSILLLITGAVMMSRHVDIPPSLIIFGYGTLWLSLTFVSTFYGFFIAAGASLIACALYLSLRADSRRQVRTGLAIGASLSLALWFRQIESFLLVLTIVGHAVVVSPTTFWRSRLRGVVAILGSGLVLFVAPWIADTTVRYGSVAARLSGGQSQEFARGLSLQVVEYWGVLRGNSFHYRNFASSPAWATGIVTTIVIAVVIMGLYGYLSKRSTAPQMSTDGVRIGATSLIWWVGVVLTSFFLFFIRHVSDRYLLMGLVFLTTGVLAGAWRLVGATGVDHRVVATALGCLVFAWVVPNVAIAGEYENVRFENGVDTQHLAQSLHRLAGGRECVGVSRFGAPQVQFGSGCTTWSSTSAEDASVRASEARLPGRLVFVWWPERDAHSLELATNEWTDISYGGDGRVVLVWSDGGWDG
jgi:hypothetical protein